MQNEKIKPIKLPEDNSPHDANVEWWYFNGHLKDKEGRHYSFMHCFFKVKPDKLNMPHVLPHLVEKYIKKGEYMYFAHSVLSDLSKKKTYKDIQNISFVSDDSFKKELLYVNYKDPTVLENFSDSEIIETSPNNFYIKNKNLNLYLEDHKKPILEGGKGYVGTLNEGSYYYSLSDLRAKGNVNINGKEVEVEGKAWMDRQWADVAYKKDKWTWFSFQFENGTEATSVYYEKGGADGIGAYIDFINKEGEQKEYKKIELIKGVSLWRSKNTKAKYPLAWKIKIPEARAVITVKAVIKNQEMIYGPLNYWEGPVKATLKMKGKSVKGVGFMELVGYPSDYNYLSLVGEKIKKNIGKKLRKVIRTYER